MQTLGAGHAIVYTEHLMIMGSKDTRYYDREELMSLTVCVQLARKVIGVNILAPLLPF